MKKNVFFMIFFLLFLFTLDTIKADEVNIPKPTVSGPAINKQFTISRYVNEKKTDFNQDTLYNNVQVIADGTPKSKQSLWFSSQVNLRYPFTNDFSIYIGSNNSVLGDGLTYTMQNDSNTAIGSNGESLGSYGDFRKYNNIENYNGFIRRALSLEFDNYSNTDFSDAEAFKNPILNKSHIAITYPDKVYKSNFNGVSNGHLYLPHYSAVAFQPTSSWQPIHVQWKPRVESGKLKGGNFSAKYADKTIDPVYVPISRFTGNPSDDENGVSYDPKAYWGFTGATGDETMIAAIAYGKLPQVPFVSLQYMKNNSGNYSGDKIDDRLDLYYGDNVTFKLNISNNPNNGLGKTLENSNVDRFIDLLKSSGIDIKNVDKIPPISSDATSKGKDVLISGTVNKNYDSIVNKYHADFSYNVDKKAYSSPSNDINIQFKSRKLLLKNSISNVTYKNDLDNDNVLNNVFPGNSKNPNGNIIKFNFDISRDGEIPDVNNLTLTQPVPSCFNTDDLYIVTTDGKKTKLSSSQYGVSDDNGTSKNLNIKSIDLKNNNVLKFSIQGYLNNKGSALSSDVFSYQPYINKNGYSIQEDVNGLKDYINFTNDYASQINITSSSKVINNDYTDSRNNKNNAYDVFAGSKGVFGDRITYKTTIVNDKNRSSSLKNVNYVIYLPIFLDNISISINNRQLYKNKSYTLLDNDKYRKLVVKNIDFDDVNQTKNLVIKGRLKSKQVMNQGESFSSSPSINLNGDESTVLNKDEKLMLHFTNNSLNFNVRDLFFGSHSNVYKNEIINSINDNTKPYVEFNDQRRNKSAFDLSFRQDSPIFTDKNNGKSFEGHIIYNNNDLSLGPQNYSSYTSGKSPNNIYTKEKPIYLKVLSNSNLPGEYKTNITWNIKNGL